MKPRPTQPRVPMVVVVVTLVLTVIAAGIAAVGAVTVGVTWDERVQVYMLQSFFDTGWHTAAAIINGFPDPNFYFGTYVYGPIGELLPHLVNVGLGREALWGDVPVTAAAYAGRHLGIALWGLMGVAAAGGTVGLLTRSWRWGVIGATALASIPLWTGHAMFNIKDTPTATGYTALTLGLVALLDRGYFTSRRVRAVALGSLAFGLVVAIGTRTALALPLAASLPLSVFSGWLIARRAGRQAARDLRASRRFGEGLAASLAAYLTLVAIYPKAFLNPIEVGAKSLLDSALYPVNEAQLVNGTWMVQPVSWLYQPAWFAAQLPVLIGLGAMGFLLWWAVQVLQWARRGPSEEAPVGIAQTVPLVLQLLMVPAAAVVGQSTLYNGTRQMLFVAPAAAILATVALWLLMTSAPLRESKPLRRGSWAVIVIGFTVPILAQLQLFPYGYTYVNAVTALRPIDGNWPTDYWRASGRELLRSTPVGGRDSCGFEQLQKGELFPCTEQPMFKPYLSERGQSAPIVELTPNEYWFIRENSGVVQMPPGCRLFTTVDRPLFWQRITIGQIAICDDRIDTGKRNMADPSKPVGE